MHEPEKGLGMTGGACMVKNVNGDVKMPNVEHSIVGFGPASDRSLGSTISAHVRLLEQMAKEQS